MAGTTIPYYNSSTHRSNQPFQVNLTAACNFGCKCNMLDVEPVCGNNGLTYFSPCHAGCTAFSSRSNYTNCACVQSNVTNYYRGVGGSVAQASVAREDFAEVTVVPVATAGPCSTPCRTIYPFLILLFFMTFVVASTQMPLLMIVLRSVSEEERAFALGMQFVIFRLFGYIPAPILFGNLIDSTCILWKSTCGETGGRCLIYDIEQFRFKYVGLCATIKVVALCIFMVDWWLVRQRRQLDKAKTITANEVVGSIVSLDRLFEEKGHHENNSGPLTNEESNKKTIQASHHHRNESKTIQIEYRNDDAECGGGGGLRPINNRKKHLRSNSCDTKIVRTNSKEFDNEIKFNKFNHSRNNSRDYTTMPATDVDFRSKLTHSRHNSRDDQHAQQQQQQQQPSNIKLIINQLKNAVNVSKADDHLNRIKFGESLIKNNHRRNNSYDQEYSFSFLSSLTKNHQPTHRNIKEDVNLLKNINTPTVTTKLSAPDHHSGDEFYVQKYSHSRNNSKDLNKIVIDPHLVVAGTSAAGIVAPILTDPSNVHLRHRRTSSKDLVNHQQHQRNLSNHKIQIDSTSAGGGIDAAAQQSLLRTDQTMDLGNDCEGNV